MSDKKTLIFQIDIGIGTQWGDEPISKFIKNNCIPSVKKYCSKYGYDYQIFTESQYETIGGKFDFLPNKLKHYAFEKYFYLDNEYEQIVYLDTDIYISNNAEKLPDIKGILCAEETGGASKELFNKVNNLSQFHPYYNAGVFMLDNPSALQLFEYMINRINNRIKSKGKNSDNMMLNEYFLEKKELINLNTISNKWNYMPFLPNSTKLSDINFFHFVGIVGKILINFMIQHSINIVDFIAYTDFKFQENLLKCKYEDGFNKRQINIQLK